MIMTDEQLSDYEQELAQLEAELAQPDAYASPRVRELATRQAELKEKVSAGTKYRQMQRELDDAKKLISDPELSEMAQAEVERLEAALSEAGLELQSLLAPKDPNDTKNAILEIRAGAGGDESSLFASELARLYTRFAERHALKVEILSSSPNEVGGYKEIIFEIKGGHAYGQLKYESGVHRVQRVPVTESAGRIHTSTATVAVLPEAEETDLEISPNDIRVDVFRASGHGGQSVNTTDSAVRITHLPTGIVVTCQDEKSQLKNKTKAMSVLRSRLLARKEEEERKTQGEARLSQIGTGDRSEKIRTYNFPQDRVTDHRIGYTTRNLTRFMDGEIDELIAALASADTQARLQSAK